MKTVLVTGASRGLGVAIVRRLLADGYRVVGAARHPTEAVERLCADGPNAFVFEAFDLANVDQIHAWVRKLSEQHGRFFGLVNNAAIGLDGVLATMHEADISRLLAVNLHAPILLSKYVGRSMMLAGEGRIVNIGSIIAATGFSGLAAYGATKAGLGGLTRSLARELGRAGITVNCVAPGYMDTEMTQDLDEEKRDQIRRRSPSGKLASGADVAGAVAYLMGPDGAMVNGVTLTVDGGSTA